MVTERWTIDELAEAVQAALSDGYGGAADARTREVPDARTIRYYTTLGLLDRAAEMRGRTALYGEKHLVQLVAIKKLQAEGRSLADVQARLAGASLRRLHQIADVDVARVAKQVARATARSARTEAATPGARTETSPARSRFWAAAPVGVADAHVAPAMQVAVPLSPDVQLLFTPTRPLEADDVTALAEAARAIHETLRARGLIPAGDRERRPR